jgi:hypothetical protein
VRYRTSRGVGCRDMEGGCPIVTNAGGLGEHGTAQKSERCEGVALARDRQLETGQFQVHDWE